ncbi:hypothetical protein E1287_38695 [Actinomadura sp. KC06]|uniref:hypothetical protein n=1 Tax=Actinomadura sp. KC06 TaxID=2530369 RepID=UPI00104D71F8|nr:hypothetical protein [Actinomadura sp. KC06]TDD23765.1 hypothetical protein E1287_38695 [Actinomadura sp. KC06]
MSGKKISPIFVLFFSVGLLLVGLALIFSLAAGAKADEADADKGEIQLQLATMLNFTLAGLSLILVGLGWQFAAGAKTDPPPIPGQAPGYPYGQQAQQQYQPQQQQAPQQQTGPPPGQQQWGQQPPGPQSGQS